MKDSIIGKFWHSGVDKKVIIFPYVKTYRGWKTYEFVKLRKWTVETSKMGPENLGPDTIYRVQLGPREAIRLIFKSSFA